MERFYQKLSGKLRCSECAGKWLSAFIAIMLLAIVVVPAYYFWHQASQANSRVIAQDVQKMAIAFAKINEDSRLLGFDLDKTPVNFLNVKAFSGPTIGSMSLEHPERWKGPYLEKTPMVSDTYYYILKTPQGYYLVPGDGIQLEGGKVLGRDIIITPHTAIEDLVKNEPALTYNGQPLIVKLKVEPRQELLARLQAEAFGSYIAE